MLASDVLQADIIFVERLDFRFEIAAQKAHQEIDFRLRTLLPVFLGEGIERQRRNSDARRGFDRRTYGGDTGAMSGDARHVPAPGPAPVSVHDDGDMLGQARWIKPQVNVSFLAVDPGSLAFQRFSIGLRCVLGMAMLVNSRVSVARQEPATSGPTAAWPSPRE